MGYYTQYELQVFAYDAENDKLGLEVESYFPEYDEIIKLISKISGYDNPFGDSCKWYDYEPDMIKVSKKFKNLIFAISGEGEEAGDIWRAYFQNGNATHYRARIVFDDPYRSDDA